MKCKKLIETTESLFVQNLVIINLKFTQEIGMSYNLLSTNTEKSTEICWSNLSER